jgi:hypothetical protein
MYVISLQRMFKNNHTPIQLRYWSYAADYLISENSILNSLVIYALNGTDQSHTHYALKERVASSYELKLLKTCCDLLFLRRANQSIPPLELTRSYRVMSLYVWALNYHVAEGVKGYCAKCLMSYLFSWPGQEARPC